MKLLFALLAIVSVQATPTITKQPTPRTNSISIGASLTNRITATSTNGAIQYQWRFNGADLANRTNVTLTFTNFQVSQAGAYTVVATDTDGSIESLSWTIDVDPTFTKVITGPLVTLPSSGGIAWGDFNNDGFTDLVIASNPINVFSNQLGTNLLRITSSYLSGLSFSGDAIWADYDNDGWTDLLLTSFGGSMLVRNSNGVFRAAAATGLPASGNIFGSAWADYDRDGNVDVFFTSGFNRAVNSLYRNVGGAFKSVTTNILTKDTPEFSQGPAWGDYDNDGWPDLFVPNSRDYNAGGTARPSFLYHNRGNGVFEKIKNVITTNNFGLCSGIWADFNNDGLLDLFACGYQVGSSPAPRLLYRNEGGGNFTRVTNAGSISTDTGYDQGAAAGDYDNDGWLDIFITSGGPNAFNDTLYHNNGDGTFTRILRGSLVNDMGEGAGCSWGDFNRDGFLDLYVSNFQNQNPEKNGFYINNGNSNHWLVVKCIGRISNRSAIGAKVRVQATINGRQFWQLREIASNGNYMSASTPDAYFGLGAAAAADAIRIEWPSGIVQEMAVTPANQWITIEEPFRMSIFTTNSGATLSTEGRGNARVERSLDLQQWEECAQRSDTNKVFVLPEASAGAAYYRLR